MVSGKRLIEAFASNQIKFRFINYTWAKDFIPNYTDVGFEFIFSGKKFSGRGTDSSENLAVVKAIMEAIERCVCAHHHIHTNGVAAHFDEGNAIMNARNELIERDVALCHYLTLSPFSKLHIAPNQSVETAVQKFSKMKVPISFLQMKSVGDLKPTICLAHGINAQTPFGLVLGLGCNSNAELSSQSAFVECARNVAFIIGAGIENRDEPVDFDSLQQTPKNHFRHALKLSTYLALGPFLETSAKNLNSFQEEVNPAFEQKVLNSDFLGLGLADLFVVQVTNPNLQKMFYGRTKRASLNLQRLANFTGNNFDLNELNSAPHIFG